MLLYTFRRRPQRLRGTPWRFGAQRMQRPHQTPLEPVLDWASAAPAELAAALGARLAAARGARNPFAALGREFRD